MEKCLSARELVSNQLIRIQTIVIGFWKNLHIAAIEINEPFVQIIR